MPSCNATFSRTQSSSIRAKSAFEVEPCSIPARAAFHLGGRSRLPTTSVRMRSSSVMLDAGGLHRGVVALQVLLHEAHVVLGAVFPQLHREVRHAFGDVAMELRENGTEDNVRFVKED